MSQIFNTLAAHSEFCYEEKRSRFIAHIWPVTSKEEGFQYFHQVKEVFPDARHHCWAYLLGNPQQALSAGFNDDGEPGGTAGKPMLNVLSQRQVGNVFAMVVRYFGGIKLGAGGLTRAYGQAVSGALNAGQLLQVVPHKTLQIAVEYALEDRVRNLLKQNAIDVSDVIYGRYALLSCRCPVHLITQLQQQLLETTAGQANLSFKTV